MADREHDTSDETTRPAEDETRDMEHDRIRSSNDRDQRFEREGIDGGHNRGYDEAVRGRGHGIDPDSAESGIDRDDTADDITPD